MIDDREDHAASAALRWYDLFSRGARDWLRHNDKVRDAVRRQLPEILSGGDLLGGGQRSVRVPVRFLEHYRFRLGSTDSTTGSGQGDVQDGDVLQQPTPGGQGQGKGDGGNEDGGIQFILELKVDDIVDWLWEELELPHLEAKTGGVDEQDYIREGWDRRGARSRLDRRRSIKEAIKRRAIQSEGPAFTDDDLRFRQLVKRKTPATQAVVFFAMDVSASMTANDRQLAKTFFFWVVQGLKRQYRHLELVFVAHTVEAWEFSEEEFFQVSGSGGTVASSAFNLVNEIIDDRFDPGRFNTYLFYASDGENFPQDREAALESLGRLGEHCNYMGLAEISGPSAGPLKSETAELFRMVDEGTGLVGRFALSSPESIWDAIRAFFQDQATEAA